MMKRGLIIPIPVLLLLLAAGCQDMIKFEMARAGHVQGNPWRTYSGPECGEVLYSHEEMKKLSYSYKDAPDPRLQILLAVCERKYMQYSPYGHEGEQKPRIRELDIQAAHMSYDDRSPDHLLAAVMISVCATSETCLADPGLPAAMTHVKDVAKSEVTVGMLYSYAALIDENMFKQQLAALSMGNDAKAIYFDLYQDAKARIVQAAGQFLTGKKHVLVDVPHTVRQHRLAYFQNYTEYYNRLTALQQQSEQVRSTGQVPKEILDGLTELRGRYLEACGTPQCRFDPFYAEVTTELVLIHIAHNDAAAVIAEGNLLGDKEMLRSSYAGMIYGAQADAAEAAREAHDKLRKAEQQGLDEQTKAAMLAGTRPADISNSDLWAPSTKAPWYESLVDKKSFGMVEGFVQSVKIKGFDAVITFKEEKKTVTEWTGCHKTNRVEAIGYDGTIYYEEKCRGTKKKQVTVKKEEPVTVPANEANAIKKGEIVIVVVNKETRKGYILSSHDGEELVQIRGDRLE
ncbi:MAG: hypothetical protein ABIJ56_19820 [Pseudomonadota bacterium]